MKTISIKKSEISKDWWVADAEGQILGRFASKISQVLRGKHKTNFTPHMDMGDFVIIVNAEKVKLSLNELRQIAKGNDNLMDGILNAVKNHATLGEISDVLREEFGTFS